MPRRYLTFAGLVVLLALVVAPSSLEATTNGAVVSNGTVALGVNAIGDLNYDCTRYGDSSCPDNPSGLLFGVRYLPNGTDGTAPGCPCEGWGVADAGSGLTGFANETAGTLNVTLDSFVATSSSAVSTVTVSDPDRAPGYQLQVVQDYHPSAATKNLIEATVTVTNTGTNPVTNLLYRRVMDWDIEPTAFNEWVTIQNPGNSPQLLFDSDDGFASSDPLGGPSYRSSTAVCGADYTGPCVFTDLGLDGTYPGVTLPGDHGALFDFQFGALAPGDSRKFTIYYGAAPSESDMLAALGSVGAEVYSLGEPDCPLASLDPLCTSLPANAGVELGEPNTFAFGFVTTSADVSITNSDGPDPVSVGGNLTYTLHVQNSGPNPAAAVTVTDPLPPGVTFVSSATTAGSCSGSATVTCALGTLESGADATVTIVVTPTAGGPLSNTASVSTTSADPKLANNEAIATTTVGVANHPPSCANVTADPAVLWPADNKLHLVRLSGGTDADGDQLALSVTGVTQNEPAGSAPDWVRASATDQVWLRATRVGTGNGRTYTIAFTVTDAHGAACSGTAVVAVPHDLGTRTR
jgi:uncharacterized repeat protein (TIGR01451 family)